MGRGAGVQSLGAQSAAKTVQQAEKERWWRSQHSATQRNTTQHSATQRNTTHRRRTRRCSLCWRARPPSLPARGCRNRCSSICSKHHPSKSRRALEVGRLYQQRIIIAAASVVAATARKVTDSDSTSQSMCSSRWPAFSGPCPCELPACINIE